MIERMKQPWLVAMTALVLAQFFRAAPMTLSVQAEEAAKVPAVLRARMISWYGGGRPAGSTPAHPNDRRTALPPNDRRDGGRRSPE